MSNGTKKRPAVKMLDNPLAKGSRPMDAGAPGQPEETGAGAQAAQQANATTKPAPKAGAAPKAAKAAVKPASKAAASGASPEAANAAAAAPAVEGAMELATPALGEAIARLAMDVPESLVTSFMAMCESLRTIGGVRVSQKALSNRDVMAALLWSSLGDPSDENAVKRMDTRVRRYKAKQLEQAAKAAAAEID